MEIKYILNKSNAHQKTCVHEIFEYVCFEMADTIGITGKRKTYLWLLILLIQNFGRLAMGIAGALFILLGAIALVYSCYELIDYLTQGEKMQLLYLFNVPNTI